MRIINKLKFLALAVLTSLIFLSCVDISSDEESSSGKSNLCLVKIAGNEERSALPSFNKDKFSYFQLVAKLGDEEPIKSEICESLSDVSLLLEPANNWVFTLTASTKKTDSEELTGIVYTGKTAETEITLAGPNKLTFKMTYDESKTVTSQDAKGSCRIGVVSPENEGNYTSIKGCLLKQDTGAEDAPESSWEKLTEDSETGILTFEKENLPVGKYYAYFQLYNGTEKLGDISAPEEIIIFDDLESTSNVELPKVALPTEFTVTYVALDSVTKEKIVPYADVLPTDSAEYKAGDEVTVKGLSSSFDPETTTKPYRFMNWSYDGAPVEANDTITMPAKNIEIVSYWKRTGPTYTVVHIKQIIGDDGTPKYDEENGEPDPAKSANVGQTITKAQINAMAKTTGDWANYNPVPATADVTIAKLGDDKEIKIYYNLKEVTYKLDLNGGEFKDGSGNTITELKGKHGTSVDSEIQAETNKPTREGFVFAGWKESIPETFEIAKNGTTFKATWTSALITGIKVLDPSEIELKYSNGEVSLKDTDKYSVIDWLIDGVEQGSDATSITVSSLGAKRRITCIAKDANGNMYSTEYITK